MTSKRVRGYKSKEVRVITNNISFYDETEHEEKYYTREELNPLIAAATKVASKVANDYIKEHLGEDYSIETELLEKPNEINLCFVMHHKGYLCVGQ